MWSNQDINEIEFEFQEGNHPTHCNLLGHHVYRTSHKAIQSESNSANDYVTIDSSSSDSDISSDASSSNKVASSIECNYQSVNADVKAACHRIDKMLRKIERAALVNDLFKTLGIGKIDKADAMKKNAVEHIETEIDLHKKLLKKSPQQGFLAVDNDESRTVDNDKCLTWGPEGARAGSHFLLCLHNDVAMKHSLLGLSSSKFVKE